MTFALYFDEDSGKRGLIETLRRNGIDVLSTDEAGRRGEPDRLQLDYAAARNGAIVTANRGDFLRLHSEWLTAGRRHAGIVIAPQLWSIGERTRRFMRLVAARTTEDMVDAVEFLAGWGEAELS